MPCGILSKFTSNFTVTPEATIFSNNFCTNCLSAVEDVINILLSPVCASSSLVLS